MLRVGRAEPVHAADRRASRGAQPTWQGRGQDGQATLSREEIRQAEQSSADSSRAHAQSQRAAR